MSIIHLTLQEIQSRLIKRELSVLDVVQAHLSQIKKTAHLNAYITVLEETAIKYAKKADEKWCDGTARILEGIPIGIKDIFCINNTRTTAGSRMLHNFVPNYTSTVVQLLKNKGIVVIGKTNMDEFAMGSTNTNSFFGPCINPWRNNNNPEDDLISGGSSGGSAVAVASYTCYAALGTDTGGSVRYPASLCGIVGLRPTYGRCSRFGIIPFASSLDQAGIFARSVHDTATVFSVIAGKDDKDSTSADIPVEDFSKYCKDNIPIDNMKVAVVWDFADQYPILNNMMTKAVEYCHAEKIATKDISIPFFDEALAAYYIIAPIEAASNLAKYDGVKYGAREVEDKLEDMYIKTRSKNFGDEVKRRIIIGMHALSDRYGDASYYHKANRVREKIVRYFRKIFNDFDAIIMPVSATTAYSIHEDFSDPTKVYANDIFTIPSNIGCVPSISIPFGQDENGLPFGIQIITNSFREDTLFKLSRMIEKHANFSLCKI